MEQDVTSLVGEELLKDSLKENKSMSNLFTLKLKDVLGAVLSSVLVALLAYVGTLTDVFNIDLKQVINIVVLTGCASLLKSLTTNSEGKFLGGLQVK